MEVNVIRSEVHRELEPFENQSIEEKLLFSAANGGSPVAQIGSNILNNSSNGSQNQTSFQGNLADFDMLPQYLLEMSPTSRNCVLAYMILFLISATGNLCVFVSVLQQLWKSRSVICVLILHLSIADLMVTFFVMPIEIFWRISVGWYAGNVLCKICQFLRAFGLYLSSMMLICISLDRYFAIIYPLKTSGAKRRGRAMLTVAWIVSALCSLPQSIVFRIQSHPDYPSFLQCVFLNFFRSVEGEVAYSVSSVSMMYFIPLLVIMFTYCRMVYIINRKSRQQHDSRGDEARGKIWLRRSDARNSLERAKIRTLRLTLIIILVFVFCWTPYAVITLCPGVQEGLFIIAAANSCVNPLIYGSHTRECGEAVMHCCDNERTQRRRSSKFPMSYRCVTTTVASVTLPRVQNLSQISPNGAQSHRLRVNISSGSNRPTNLLRLSPSFRVTLPSPNARLISSNGPKTGED